MLIPVAVEHARREMRWVLDAQEAATTERLAQWRGVPTAGMPRPTGWTCRSAEVAWSACSRPADHRGTAAGRSARADAAAGSPTAGDRYCGHPLSLDRGLDRCPHTIPSSSATTGSASTTSPPTSRGRSRFRTGVELRKRWDAALPRAATRCDAICSARWGLRSLSALAEHPDRRGRRYTLIRRVLGSPANSWTTGTGGYQCGFRSQTHGIGTRFSLQAVPVDSIDDLLDPQTGRLLGPGVGQQTHHSGVQGGVGGVSAPTNRRLRRGSRAGRWLLLAGRNRTLAEGRYLAVDLLVVAGAATTSGGRRSTGRAMLEPPGLVPDADRNIWWTGF